MSYAIFKRATLFLLCCSLWSCVSSESVPISYYYVLEANTLPTHKSEVTNKTASRNIKVSSIEVPNYLSQNSLVMKLDDHQIKIANYHFWAEDIRSSIQRVLINQLNKEFEDISFVRQCSKCDELNINIAHFYPSLNGEVVLAGMYEFKTSNKSTKYASFNLRTQLEQGGYNESVSKMHQLLLDLAAQIQL